MKIEKEIIEMKERQAFWSGVLRGVIGTAAFFVGLVTVIYYVMQIVLMVK